MQEDVVINVFSKGTDIVESEFLKLAEGADKVSVSTDKLTGKVKGTIETIDKQSGIVKKLVVEDGKLVSATESVVKVMQQQDTATKQVTVSTDGLSAAAGKFLVAIGAYQLIKNATMAIIEHMGAVQAVNAQLMGLTNSTAQYNAASLAFQAASNGNVTVMAAMVSSFAELQTIVPASSLNVEHFAATMGAAANAMKATGADAKGVSDGIAQLSKAMSDGRITGEEFAALYVKFPALGKTLADSLGMSIETMSKLGISTQAATKALLDKQDQLKKTADANMTLTQAIESLKDAFFKELDQLNKNYDLYQNVVNVIKAFIQAVGVLIGVLATLFKWLSDIAAALGLIATRGNDATNAINKQTAASNAQASAANSAANALNRQAAATGAVNAANSAGKSNYAPNSNPNSSYRSSVPEPEYTRKLNQYGNEYNVATEVKYRASGGPVRKGSPYIVGENGPEFFVPGASGNIIPNGDAGSLAGVSGGASSADRVSAVDIVAEGVGRALESPLKAVSETLDSILAVLKSAQAQASAASASAGGNAALPGTSAINNYQQNGMVAAVSDSFVSSGGTKTGTGSTGTAPATVDYTKIRSYAVTLADLIKRYQNNLWADPTFKFTRTQQSYAAYMNYLDTIPQGILEQVKVLAGSLLPATMSGFTARTGGSFRVGGSTGADSKLMQMMVSPGEQVDVRTRRQVANDEAMSVGNGGSPTIIFQISTPDADSFQRSDKQVLREFAVKVNKALRKS